MVINKNEITVGSDPEFFLQDSESRNLVSAIGIIPGSKKNPHYLEKDGFAIQVDNVACEFNVPPCKDYKEMWSNFEYIFKTLRESYLPKNIEPLIISSAIFPKELLEHPIAKTFGCEEDFCAWTECVNPKPKSENPCLRTAAGHIHIGYNNPTLDTSISFIKALDLFISIPLVFEEKDKRRRELYGKAGCFRFTKFGFEYRTPGNLWITDISYVKFIFDAINRAVDFVNDNRIKDLDATDVKKIQLAINNNNKMFAKQLVNKFKIPLFNTIYENSTVC